MGYSFSPAAGALTPIQTRTPDLGPVFPSPAFVPSSLNYPEAGIPAPYDRFSLPLPWHAPKPCTGDYGCYPAVPDLKRPSATTAAPARRPTPPTLPLRSPVSPRSPFTLLSSLHRPRLAARCTWSCCEMDGPPPNCTAPLACHKAEVLPHPLPYHLGDASAL